MKLKYLSIFISGFIAGVVYCLYRDVFSKPVEPRVWTHIVTIGDDKQLQPVVEVDNNGYVVTVSTPGLVIYDKPVKAYVFPTDDTQPVYIGVDENEWKPEPWHDDIGGM